MLQLYINHSVINQKTGPFLLAPGDHLQLTANATGYRGVAEIQWRQNGQTVVPNRTEIYPGDGSGYTDFWSQLSLVVWKSHMDKISISAAVLGQNDKLWKTENVTIIVEKVLQTETSPAS